MICAYCDAEEIANSDTVPVVGDDATWQELATEHEASCEWIATRAHRIEPVTFGLAMRLARRAHGLNQAELGKAMGMLVPAISRCERDGSTISEQTMHKLAAALSEPLSAIIARAEQSAAE